MGPTYRRRAPFAFFVLNLVFLLQSAACIGPRDTGAQRGAGSAWSVESTEVPADARATAIFRLTLRDVAGQPLVGRQVRLSSANANVQLTQPAPTAVDGTTVGAARCGVAGEASVRASFVEAGVTYVLEPSYTLHFVDGADAVAPALRLTLSPNVAVANDADAVHLYLAATGKGVAQAGTVEVLGVDASDTLATTGVALDANGTWEATLRSTRAGVRHLQVRLGGTTLAADAMLLAGPPDPAVSDMALLWAPVPDATVSPTAGPILRVTLRDAFGNPVAGRQVALASPAAGTTFVPSQATSDANGELTVAVESNTVGSIAVVATVAPSSASGGANGIASPSAGPEAAGAVQFGSTVTLAAGPANATTSLLWVSAAPVVADGVASTQVELRLRDAAGRPVAGGAATLTASGTQNALDHNALVTDANGYAWTALRSARAERKVLTAQFVGGAVGANVTFVPGPADASRSGLSLSPNTCVRATGIDAAAVRVLLRDALDNAVVAEVVNLAVVSGAAQLSATTAQTDANGTVAATLTSLVGGDSTVRLTVGSRTWDANCSFVAVVDPNTSSMVANANVAVAGVPVGVQLSLRDARGRPVPTAVVAFGAADVGTTLTPNVTLTDPNGNATATFVGTVAGPATLYADVGATYFSQRLVVVPAPASPAHSALVSSTGPTPATGHYPNVLVLGARDVYGNAVPGAAVHLSLAGTGLQVRAADNATNANGRATAQVTSSVVQAATATATLDGNAAPSLVANITFVSPPLVDPAQSSFVISPNAGLRADATAQAQAHFVARAVDGRALGYQSVSLEAPTASLEFWPPAGATDANGSFVASVAARTTTAASVWARSGGARLRAAASFVAPGPRCAGAVRLGGALPGRRSYQGVAAGQALAADLDGDGHVDLLLSYPPSYYAASATEVYWNAGGGALNQYGGKSIADGPTNGSVPAYSYDPENTWSQNQAAVVDLDGDGRPDLLYASQSAGKVVIFRNVGNGNFADPVAFALVGQPVGLAAADLDGDGLVDLAVSNAADDTLNIFLATAPLAWQHVWTLPVGAGAGSVAIGDLDGDGRLDAAVCSHGAGTVATVTNVAAAPSARAPLSTGLTSLASLVLADINLDGASDVLVGSGNDGRFVVAISRGDGTLLAPNAYTTPSGSAAQLGVADLDADGFLDVVAGTGSALGVWSGDANGRLTARATLTMSAATSDAGRPGGALVLADFTDDGRPDVAYGVGDGRGVVLLANLGQFHFAVPAPTQLLLASTPRVVTAVDLDGDGGLDAVVGDDAITFFRGDGHGNLAAVQTYVKASARPTSCVVAADLNLDGIADLVVCNGDMYDDGDGFDVLLGSGGGNLLPAVHYAPKMSSYYSPAVAVADFDGDGLLDVVVASEDDNTVTLLRGDGSGTLVVTREVPVDRPQSLTWGDVNDDGLLDWVVNADGGLVSGLGRGDGNFTLVSSATGGSRFNNLRLADFDGDGVVDLAGLYGYGLGLALGLGDGTFADIAQLSPNDQGLAPPSVADLNGDGRVDLIFAQRVNLNGPNFGVQLSYLLNDPSMPIGPNLLSQDVGDLDADGRLDLLVVSNDPPSMLIFHNDGCL